MTELDWLHGKLSEEGLSPELELEEFESGGGARPELCPAAEAVVLGFKDPRSGGLPP